MAVSIEITVMTPDGRKSKPLSQSALYSSFSTKSPQNTEPEVITVPLQKKNCMIICVLLERLNDNKMRIKPSSQKATSPRSAELCSVAS